MQVDCNKFYNKKAIKLLEGIEKWASTDMVARNIQSPYQAALDGTMEVISSVFTSILTTVTAFSVLLFILIK